MTTSSTRTPSLVRGAALVGGATLVAAASARAQGGSERHTLRGEAAVWNVAGTIRVVPGTGSDVVVDVVRRGRDAGKLRIVSGAVRGRDAVRVVYPEDDVIYPAMG